VPGTWTHSLRSAIRPSCTLTTMNAQGHISRLSDAKVAASS
jgi:hypothetical protein